MLLAVGSPRLATYSLCSDDSEHLVAVVSQIRIPVPGIPHLNILRSQSYVFLIGADRTYSTLFVTQLRVRQGN